MIASGLQAWGGVAEIAAAGLIAAVWQGIVLAVLVAVGLRLFPKAPAGVRFAVWFGVFVLVAMMPGTGWLHGGRSEGQAAWLTLDARWCGVIAAVWAAASAVRAVTLVLAVMRVRALWKRARPLEFEGVGVGSRGAKLCVSDEVDRPAVIGFFAPKILIPSWLVEKMTARELEQVVLHESMHLSRADDWMNLVQKIALVVFPLNPVLAWVERRLCFERELACDELVLDTTGAPKAYAACLASLAGHRLGRTGLALALGAVGRESELGRRVRRILSRRETMRPMQARLVLGGAMLGLLGAATGLERCPQVVGFGPGAGVSAVVSAPLGVEGGTEGYRFEPVVFHPVTTEVRPAEVVRHGKKVRPGKTAVRLAGAGRGDLQASVVRGDETAIPAGEGLASQVALKDAEVRGAGSRAELVVFTAWRADGTRMVMTTLRTVSGVPQDQVHPYAAVPVEDGWLLFEL